MMRASNADTQRRSARTVDECALCSQTMHADARRVADARPSVLVTDLRKRPDPRTRRVTVRPQSATDHKLSGELVGARASGGWCPASLSARHQTFCYRSPAIAFTRCTLRSGLLLWRRSSTPTAPAPACAMPRERSRHGSSFWWLELSASGSVRTVGDHQDRDCSGRSASAVDVPVTGAIRENFCRGPPDPVGGLAQRSLPEIVRSRAR